MNDKLILREVTAEDEKLLLDWVNETEVRNQSKNTNLITAIEHKNWFYNKINNQNVKMWILEIDSVEAGQIRWDLNNNRAILDYSIGSLFRGKGLGQIMINHSIEKLKLVWPGVLLIAEVKKNNIPSIKTLSSSGFKKNNLSKLDYLIYEFEL